MPLSPGDSFGSYRVVEPLGRGGMASVYKVYEGSLDRHVALKVLPREFLHDPAFADRFRHEAKIIARLEHPHIVPIYAFGIDEGIPWMSMRLIGGGTMWSLMKGGKLDARKAIEILSEAARALEYAHASGVLHRDVKPQNILVDEQGHAYLSDFGIAKMIEGSAMLTKTGTVPGTPRYMAPEQARGEKIDHRTDVYSLGVVAYEVLCGRPPFSADTPVALLVKHVTAPIPVPLLSEMPETLFRPVLKALAKTPEERWPSATAFTNALRRGLDEGLSAPPPLAATVLSAAGIPRGDAEATKVAGRAGASLAGWTGRLVGGIVTLLALLVLASLVTYSPRDPLPFFEPVAPGPTRNAVGPIGALVAALLIPRLLGAGAWLVPGLAGAAGLRLLLGRRLRAPLRKGAAALLLLVAVSLWLTLLWGTVTLRGEVVPAGGAVGELLVGLAATRVGMFGTSVGVLLLLLLALLLLYDPPQKRP